MVAVLRNQSTLALLLPLETAELCGDIQAKLKQHHIELLFRWRKVLGQLLQEDFGKFPNADPVECSFWQSHHSPASVG